MRPKRIMIINNERDADDLGWIPRLQSAIEAIEPVQFVIQHFSNATIDTIKTIEPNYIILYGRVTHHWDMAEIMESYAPELKFIKELEIPTLGICAGFELMAISYGGQIGRMVESGDENILEEGYVEQSILKRDPLFDGLREAFYCRELHREEVKGVPSEFKLLASSEMCKVQAIKHIEKLIYGIQFHPEWYNADYPDGSIILKNFINLKG